MISRYSMMTAPTPIPLSLYIHMPWCVKKCPYCDFNSHEINNDFPEHAYIDALLKDLSLELPTIWGRRLESVFIGGGTPSLFSADAYDRLFAGLRQMLPMRPSLEITMEANPGTFEQERFKAYREVGINRLSIGIQSFDPAQLITLGRIHDDNEAHKATEIANLAGFDNINLDLMFGLPQQTLEQAQQDLKQAIAYQPQHLSWYQLTLEPNTFFHHQPPQHLPDDDLLADMHEAGITLLSASGYQQYEVSAYAQAGKQCRHNRNYWEFGDYVAIGAGAHGKLSHYSPAQDSTLTITRYQKYKHPETYLAEVDKGTPKQVERHLPEQTMIAEFMLNALRLKEGISLDLFKERTGLALTQLSPQLELAINKGLLHAIEQNQAHIQATEMGWRFLNNLIALFLEQ